MQTNLTVSAVLTVARALTGALNPISGRKFIATDTSIRVENQFGQWIASAKLEAPSQWSCHNSPRWVLQMMASVDGCVGAHIDRAYCFASVLEALESKSYGKSY